MSKTKYILFIIMFVSLQISKCLAQNSNTNSLNKDSCKIALKFDQIDFLKILADKNYSGELVSYRGSDTSQLDFKHILMGGEPVKSYFYDANGKVQEEYTFQCGALHGIQKWYYENGKLAKTIPYSYGYRQGTAALYDTTGSIRQSIIFERDSVAGEVQIHQNFSITVEGIQIVKIEPHPFLVDHGRQLNILNNNGEYLDSVKLYLDTGIGCNSFLFETETGFVLIDCNGHWFDINAKTGKIKNLGWKWKEPLPKKYLGKYSRVKGEERYEFYQDEKPEIDQVYQFKDPNEYKD